jgi:hypothetical protein
VRSYDAGPSNKYSSASFLLRPRLTQGNIGKSLFEGKNDIWQMGASTRGSANCNWNQAKRILSK